jgi:antitoxin component of RelBE/YafQ-DinJ toxin-antitoxin module
MFMPRKTNDRLSLSINSKTKRQFTAICALRGINMSDIVEELVDRWIEENATPKFLAALDEAEETPSPSKGKGGQEKKTPKQ